MLVGAVTPLRVQNSKHSEYVWVPESAELEMLKDTVSTVVIGVNLLLLGTVSTSIVQLSKFSRRFFFNSLLAIFGYLLCSSHVEPRVCVLQ